ncbi:hypothetical protein L917_12959 [Phytophthora nicotianae]|uniref:RxLR effector protein n=1 Tax=Phytophthora nicotianae TaxID=4792 RepID=W2KTK5_PHYNI|nr:hypothetical protein L915_13249 [Phytophthora nicotianae]ETL87934.1 hypothetical protein L917_12959 [Phytophthora nicotianae]ETM41170.1 hypothetical protein L914_13042 [Phytophthora nicotianae]
MRFSAFVVLLVATFLVCYSNFASSESVDEERHFHLPGLGHGHGHSHAAKIPAINNKDNVAKIAGGFLENLRTKTALTKAVKAVQASDGDEVAVRKAITAFAAAKDAVKTNDEQIAKLSSMIATTAQKNPKSWPRLRKFAKIALGATVGGYVIYLAYKLMFDRNSSGSGAMTLMPDGSA